MITLLLCSGSPRRRQLLASLGLAFELVPPDVDETRKPGEAPLRYAERLAVEKAAAGRQLYRARAPAPPDGVVALAADTIVVSPAGEVLGKPADRGDAARMLQLLSGKEHRVVSALCVAGERVRSCTVESTVRFARLDEARIAWLVASGECDDKAGAYAVQGLAGAFVEGVEGSLTNIVGLPLVEAAALLADEGVRTPWR